MKKVEYHDAITVKLSEKQRHAIERLADREETTLGSATRQILEQGIAAMGLVIEQTE